MPSKGLLCLLPSTNDDKVDAIVTISSRDRKILWAMSGNACARCDGALVLLPEVQGDVHAMVGQECHIVARSLAGPRGEEDPRGGLDGYANLILLCANCHAIIDGQPQRWTPDALRDLKREHEQKVEKRTAEPAPLPRPELKLRGREQPLRLERITNGDALVRLVDSAFSFMSGAADGLSPSQREVVGDFLQSAHDWGEISGDIGPKGQMDAAQDLDDGIEALREEGLVVYAAKRRLTLEDGDGHESPWPEAVIKVFHERDVLEKPKAAA